MHKRSCPMHSGTHTQPTREKTCNLEVQQYMHVYLIYHQARLLQEVLSKYLQCVYCAQLLAWPAWEPSVLSPSTNALSPPSGYLWLYMWSYELKRQNQSGCMHALIHIQAAVPAHNLARRDTYRRAHWGHRYVMSCCWKAKVRSTKSTTTWPIREAFLYSAWRTLQCCPKGHGIFTWWHNRLLHCTNHTRRFPSSCAWIRTGRLFLLHSTASFAVEVFEAIDKRHDNSSLDKTKNRGWYQYSS